MTIKLRVLEGPDAGREYSVQPGVIIGRGSVDISLSDGKISSRHARVDLAPSGGGLVLVDLGSTNGLRVDKQRVNNVALLPGVKILVGRTLFEVVREGAQTAAPVPTTKATPSTKDAPPPPPAPSEDADLEELTPWEYLSNFSLAAKSRLKDKPRELRPFNPMVKLKIVRGLQTGTEWVVGYGPRPVGLGTLDLHLFETSAPPIAFTLIPKGVSVIYETDFPDQVKLNGRPVSSEAIKDGDTIEVGGTSIQIGFAE